MRFDGNSIYLVGMGIMFVFLIASSSFLNLYNMYNDNGIQFFFSRFVILCFKERNYVVDDI